MLYLFTFGNLKENIILSKERNISLSNITSEYEKIFFQNTFLKYDTDSLYTLRNYLKNKKDIKNIIKINIWIDLKTYINKKIKYKQEHNKEQQLIIENHNIFNVILFSLSVLMFNNNLIDNNIYLENLDSNKIHKIRIEILMEQFTKYLDFSFLKDDLKELFRYFDFNYNKYNIDNFIYIWELLDLYNSSKSDYFKFIQLISIIEFLIIKWNKDITKQFIFKCGIIIERLIKLNQILDKKFISISIFDKKKTPQELNIIYDIRSYIVHGNIKEMNKKYPEIKDNYINFKSLFSELKSICAGILYLYIQEPEYIDFIKNN